MPVRTVYLLLVAQPHKAAKTGVGNGNRRCGKAQRHDRIKGGIEGCDLTQQAQCPLESVHKTYVTKPSANT